MDSARWHRIQSIFHGAADVPQPEQRAFVGAACGDDQSDESQRDDGSDPPAAVEGQQPARGRPRRGRAMLPRALVKSLSGRA